MSRHPSNSNLSLHSGQSYQMLPLLEEKGPFVEQYLGRLHQILYRALDQYPRIFAFRVDLRFPAGIDSSSWVNSSAAIQRFIDSFKAKIRHNRDVALRLSPYAHDTQVWYAWAKEAGNSGSTHYHLVILVNRDAFCTLGSFRSKTGNMVMRLQEAWASALGLSMPEVQGLVHIPENPAYDIFRDDIASQAHFFYRASYLCKAKTKVYVDGKHCFGASRI